MLLISPIDKPNTSTNCFLLIKPTEAKERNAFSSRLVCVMTLGSTLILEGIRVQLTDHLCSSEKGLFTFGMRLPSSFFIFLPYIFVVSLFIFFKKQYKLKEKENRSGYRRASSLNRFHLLKPIPITASLLSTL